MTATIPLSRGELAAASWCQYLLIRKYHPAGDVARNLPAADPRLWHAVPGDGREVPLRIGSRREGPASLPGPSEFRGELCQRLRDFKWKAVDLQRECLLFGLKRGEQTALTHNRCCLCVRLFIVLLEGRRQPSRGSQHACPGALQQGCISRWTKAQFRMFVHLISNIYRNVILSLGDLVSKTKGEEEQFSSISDQYQESYFHPLIMTGTQESVNLWNSTDPHFIETSGTKISSLTPFSSLSPHLKSFSLPACH